MKTRFSGYTNIPDTGAGQMRLGAGLD